MTRLGAAFVMLALLGIFAPATARAGCAHPFAPQSPLFDHSGRLDGLITGDMDQASNSPWGAPANRKPCSGPGCSSRVPIPVPTASTGLEGMPQWGVLGSSFILEAVPTVRRPLDAPATLALAPIAAIFHPPRG